MISFYHDISIHRYSNVEVLLVTAWEFEGFLPENQVQQVLQLQCRYYYH